MIQPSAITLYFATFYGGFGPVAHDPVVALGAVVLMNALGPLYAWLNVKLAAPHHAGARRE